MLDLEKITLKVREIALRAGAFLRKERSGFDRSKVEKKNAHDYVSYVDKESERRIVAQLRELLPEAGFIAEEGSGSPDYGKLLLAGRPAGRNHQFYP